MIDCGAFQGHRKVADEKNRNFSFSPEKLEAVILTHAHYDHCGLLPVLTKTGFDGNIYATPATRDLADLIMMDSARIQARDAEYLRKQAQKKGEKFTWQPLFTEKDCVKAANQIVTLSYNRKMYIAPDVELEFFDAGHILGSAFAYITIKGQRASQNGAFAGMGKSHPLWNRLFGWMSSSAELHAAGVDGMDERRTKPDRRKATPEEQAAYTGEERRSGYDRREGKDEIRVLFTGDLGRKIPPIPIYVDSPMAMNATSIFQVHPECYDNKIHELFLQHHKNPFGFNELSFVTSVEESKGLNDKKGPMIIISADGMCEAGRVLHHLANNISDPRNTILIVGYMAENTLGRKIRDHAKQVNIMGDVYDVNADVETINAFSAHADYTEMTAWLDKIDTSRLKQIFMVHGEEESQLFFKDYLAEHGYKNTTIVKYDEVYTLE